MAMDTEQTLLQGYPLYDTSFTIHRLSPLFHHDIALNYPALVQYASTFRNLLAGEVLRGVRVGLASEDDVLARVGGLQNVQWSILGGEEEWEKRSENDITMFDGTGRGIFVEVIYEKVTCSAILLHDDSAQEEPGFWNYPLLLTRMPGALRETFLDFLTTTFDTRTSILKLPSIYLTNIVEKYFLDITHDEAGPLDDVQADKALRISVKEIQLTISFDIPGGSNALKSLDINISKEDVYRMIASGRKIQEIGENASKADGPFMTAVKQYLQAQIALNSSSSHVSLTRIGCGAFVISTEGKVKLIAPPNGTDEESPQAKAINALIHGLIELSRGGTFATISNIP